MRPMCNPSFLVVFLGGIGKKRKKEKKTKLGYEKYFFIGKKKKKKKKLNLDMRNDFWQGHILSTTGADLLVVDSVCVCVCVCV